MNGSDAPRLALLPAHADPLAWAADALIASHRGELPDLSNVIVLLPAASQAARLRRLLLASGDGALLGPTIGTLTDFARRGEPAAPLSALDCRLILAGALRRFPGLFPGHDEWALAEALFALFEELSATAPELADDETRFLDRTGRGYGGARMAATSREARAVHLLWRAYLRDTDGRSPAVFHLRSLRMALAALAPHERLYLIGFDDLSAAEAALLQPALATGHARLWLHGPVDGRGRQPLARLAARLGLAPEPVAASPDPLAAAFDDSGTPLLARVAPPPSAPRVRVATARHPEHEARVVDLAIRRALLAGKRDIAVVTQDRRLARRLRALLERAHVPLRDEAGWALSTSAAAASLGHWLDCCEQNFSFRALLDLLKSSFFALPQPTAVDDLERLIYASGTTAGLDRYRRLDGAPQALLAQLEQAARPLPAAAAPPRAGHEWSAGLLQSLQLLPLWRQWQGDAAGAVLIRQLEELHAALQRQQPRLSWREFRQVVERLLEQATFIPQSEPGPVRLLTLEQARGLRCDLLVLAGASAARFPGTPSVEPVFNHGVRAELGLAHWEERLELQLARFRGLLHAAPELLISHAPEEEDEAAVPCPWVEALQVLGLATADEDLPRLAADPRTEIAGGGDDALPRPQPAPRPVAPVGLLPRRLSASGHQALIDCPYQFFASACLGLRRSREPDEPVDRRDFGERVHLILQAFHQQLPGLPAPFAETVTPANRGEAQIKLEQLARAAFAGDLRNRALAKVWLAEFLELLPELSGWLAARGTDWPQVLTEAARECELAPGLVLHGRIDRLERNRSGDYGVVDYKTGEAPSAEAVATGESVQAVHYALLAEPCTQVEYLMVGRNRKPAEPIAGEALEQARQGVRERLTHMIGALHAGAPLPAQGDENTCGRCDYAGLCRNGAWDE